MWDIQPVQLHPVLTSPNYATHMRALKSHKTHTHQPSFVHMSININIDKTFWGKFLALKRWYRGRQVVIHIRTVLLCLLH